MIYIVRKIRKKFSPGGHGNDQRRSLLLFGLFVILSIFLAVSLLFNLYQLRKSDQIKNSTLETSASQPPTVHESPREPLDASSEISGHWYGLCPKNSIHSVDDFRRIVAADPLLAQHFSDFNWNKARMGYHKSDIYTHLSYRKNNRIGVTRKIVKLPAGDGYITDGNRWIRTYCGNDYILVNAPKPTDSEKVDSDLNRLIDRADNSSKISESSEGGSQRSREADPIPEPGTVLLVGAGVTGQIIFYVKRRQERRNRREQSSQGDIS